jgi:hypothetical protein
MPSSGMLGGIGCDAGDVGKVINRSANGSAGCCIGAGS